jgi:hypothetical protein
MYLRGHTMRHSFLALLFLCMLTAGGCIGDKGKELFETAQFEEKQHNVEHAVQLYREIIRKHAGSDYAAKAGQRLTELGQER